METYFAPAERASREEISQEIDALSNNAVITALLSSISGLLAVLNEQRQIVSVNDAFLKELGCDDLLEVLELRPGEAVHCVHAHEEAGGCGTSKYCETCGAAIAIVSSLELNQPVERLCALTATKNGTPVDLALLVRSQPIVLEDRRFLLLFIQDITLHERRAALERTFFHDINNMLYMLVGTSELLVSESPSTLAQDILEASYRLEKEVTIQRTLLESESYTYQPKWHIHTTNEILADLQSYFVNHPAARGKHLNIESGLADVPIRTDISLLLRVLCNMIINGLEATDDGGVVSMWLEDAATDTLSFHVWNNQEIPEAIAMRIFQRNFSTKGQAGRGVGTYSMKLFGEKILGGEVSFKTSAETGTVFELSLPKN